MTTLPAADTDVAMVLGMASTAMPFAGSPEAEAERWLRILRLHGQAGAALQALGVSEAPLQARGARTLQAPPPGDPDAVTAVSENAIRAASERGSRTVGTGDVLVAVMQVYGEDFERVLQVYGTDRDEVLERLGASWPERGGH